MRRYTTKQIRDGEKKKKNEVTKRPQHNTTLHHKLLKQTRYVQKYSTFSCFRSEKRREE
jgi:hypothetical protein